MFSTENTTKTMAKRKPARGGNRSHKPSKTKIIFSIILIFAIFIYSLFDKRSFQQEQIGEDSTQTESEVSGKPGASTVQLEFPGLSGEEKLINYNGFTVSYNSQAKIPHWVAYTLENYETYGENTRNGRRFRSDNSLPYPQAEDDDYRNSGWTRGHMAPAADFKWSDEALGDTFYLTNCCPQSVTLNEGMWNTLENKVREYAVEYDRIHIITGPVIGKNTHGTIGYGEVVVPDAFFKALLVHDGTQYHSIAFIMKNSKTEDDNIESNMQGCAMSVNTLEEKIGFDLFAALDDAIEEDVERRCKLSVWGL